jgi:putative toxin-antitoxin system antitoxin component (TIGR02293 family)
MKETAIWQKGLAAETEMGHPLAMKTRKAKETVYPEVQDNVEMAQRVEEGLPVAEVVEFGRKAGFTNEELARLIRIPPRTYARRVAAKGRLKVPEGERAVRLMRLFDQARRVFGDHDRARQWFNSPVLALGRKTPLEYAQTEPGAREVENVIGRIEHGVFS